MVQNPAALTQLVELEKADVLCLQETKLQDKGVEEIEARTGLKGWHHAWNCSTARKGYSGTAIISKRFSCQTLNKYRKRSYEVWTTYTLLNGLDIIRAYAYPPRAAQMPSSLTLEVLDHNARKHHELRIDSV